LRKYIVWTIMLLMFIAFAGCAATRKPAPQPQAKTYVVPEVSRVSFETVNLRDCPKVVRDVARSIRDRKTNTWVQSGNNAYILASTGNSKSNNMEVDEILQRVPQQGMNWLDVKLKYSGRAAGLQNGSEANVTVVRADVNDRPEGVGFEVVETATGEVARTSPAAPAKQAPANQNTSQQGSMVVNTGAEITQPAPNQEVTSPLKVSGNLKSPAQKIRLRLVTRNGQVMKEDELPTPGGDGSFETTMSYNPPSLPRTGMVEVISVDSSGNDQLLARVPVVIK